ncbi:MAG: hypothetical protein RIF37_10625 [Rhodospirillaceae bacterium]
MTHHPTSLHINPHTTVEQSAVDESAASRTPRPVFMGDPVTDAQWDMIIALTNELGATRARLDALERVLVERQAIPEGVVDAWLPDEEAAVARTLDTQAYIRRVFNTLTQGT